MKSKNIVALLLSFLIGYLLYLIMVPFFIPIFWASVFVILFYPYYQWLQRRLIKNRSLASVVACATIGLFLIIPMGLMGVAVANELYNLYQWAENYIKEISTRAHRSPIFVFPFIEKYLGQYIDLSALDIRAIVANGVREMTSFASAGIKGFIKNFAQFFFNTLLAFFTMFFLFRDGGRIIEVIKDLLPISDTDKEKILDKTRDVIYATIYGGVFVGAVQGALGGIAFWFLGIPGAILWGFVMFMFSFLPSVGSAVVWVPAAAYLFLIGSYGKGIILVLWGGLIIGLIDNILRPFIVSGRTNLHPLLLFFSILGAVNVFGFIGIIAGPLILSIGQATVEIYYETLKPGGNNP